MLEKGNRVLSRIGKTNSHCICALDCDDVELTVLKNNLKERMNEYDLSTFYIFRTSKNHYSAVCFSIVDADELLEILKISLADVKQVWAFENLKTIGFRISKKHGHLPEPFAILRGRSKKRSKSNGHIIFFRGLYPMFVKEKLDGVYDGITFETFTNPHLRGTKCQKAR